MTRAGLLCLFVALCLIWIAPTTPSSAQEAAPAQGAILRALDRISGQIEDIKIPTGQKATYGRLRITLFECRYPADNPLSDAFALLAIEDQRERKHAFRGWMIASSPALNALDHPRYDVWVLRCLIPANNPAPSEG